MTGQYPDDILKAADAVIDRGYNEGLVDAICKALLAERERNAAIADRLGASAVATEIRK